jgi:hypothetical protein
MLATIFKPGSSAEKSGAGCADSAPRQVINGVKFRDGIEVQKRVRKADHRVPRRIAAINWRTPDLMTKAWARSFRQPIKRVGV